MADQRHERGIDCVIVAYRCENLLRDCLRSLAEHPPRRPLDIHVVDNASGDGTAEMVAAEFPGVRLTRNPTNAGFGAANNLAIRAGRREYVLVLNPDTRLTPGALETLASVLDTRPELGMVGPRLERPDGTFDHAAKRSFPTALGALAHFTGIGRRPSAPARLAQYRAPELAPDESGIVDALNGAFMLIRRAALDEVGLFDEGFWMYMEDLDLSYRFAAAGWPSFYEPAARVVHVKAGTSGEIRSARLNRAFHYGMLRFYRKHYAPERGAIRNAFVYTAIAAKGAASIARNAVRRRLGAARSRGGRARPGD